MTDTQNEAFAQACAELNNVALPNVQDILTVLRQLTTVVELDPYLERDPRLARARQILRDFN